MTPDPTIKLKVAINPDIVDKNEGGKPNVFVDGWRNVELTPAELAQEIDHGIAYCAQLKGRRRAENFLCCNALSLDFDGARRMDEVLNEPLVKQHATLVYTTVNHTEETNRFRVIFALPTTITDRDEMRSAARGLVALLGSDPSTIDATRLFFGARGSRPQILGGILSDEVLSDIIRDGGDRTHGKKQLRRQLTTISRLRVRPDLKVRSSNGTFLDFAEAAQGTRIYCPFHLDAHPSAFVVASKASVKGIHCSSCAQTFWPTPPEHPYDFGRFDEAARAAYHDFQDTKDLGPLRALFDRGETPYKEGRFGCAMELRNERFLSHFPVKDGLTFVKSPMGSGKTEALKASIAADENKVILVGHRVALLKNLCDRLGIIFYRDVKGDINEKAFGVCLDSLPRVVVPPAGASGLSKLTIVLDESEQVVAHLLSDTMQPDVRSQVFITLRSLLRRARKIIALDANLGFVSVDTVSMLSQLPRVDRDFSLIVNDYKPERTINVFDSGDHLVERLFNDVQAERRLFVTSSSKKRIVKLHSSLKEEFDNTRRVLLVTADTMGEATVREFIDNPSVQALRYDVILASPALSSGVDISFPDGAGRVDAVYGFLDSKTITHLDFDQQIARVRNPGEVNVWVTPAVYHFDILHDVVKFDIQRQNLVCNVLKDHSSDGSPIYDQHDMLWDVATRVVTEQRASKNELRRHFIEHKARQGWHVNLVKEDVNAAATGNKRLNDGFRIAARERVQALTYAQPLTRSAFQTLKEKAKRGKPITQSERWRVERAVMEQFYRQPISDSLIKIDCQGGYRDRVRMFEALQKERKLLTRYGREVAKPLTSRHARVIKAEHDGVSLLRILLEATPLMTDCELRRDAVISSTDLIAFADLCAQKKSTIETVLKIQVRADVTQKPVAQLNATLACLGQECARLRKEKRMGKTTYFYSLVPSRLNDMESVVANRAAHPNRWLWYERAHGLPETVDDEEEAAA